MTAPIGCLDEREAFEVWFCASGDYEPEWLDKSGANHALYMDADTENMWQAFQAGVAITRPALAPQAARFAMTYCSQCGKELGPANAGVSHCADHPAPVPRDLAARFVEQHDALRRALEVIAVGDSADPVRDAGDELVALGIWSGGALEQHRAMLAAAPHQAQEAQGDRHGE